MKKNNLLSGNYCNVFASVIRFVYPEYYSKVGQSAFLVGVFLSGIVYVGVCMYRCRWEGVCVGVCMCV